MRKFFYKIICSLSGLYLCLTVVFSYELLISEVPDKVYVTRGDSFELDVDFPLVISEEHICRLFGIIPIKEIEVSVVDEKTVYACGKIVGIYTQTQGVFVIDTCPIETENGAETNPVEDKIVTGDYIIAINDNEIDSKEELVEMVGKSKGNRLKLTVLRDGKTLEVDLVPALGKNGKYMLGIWVKDDQAGVGTMTYFTDTGE